jgi:RpiR family carbohydrate utilization transcriptional regulator
MATRSCLQTIRSAYSSFSPKEQTIADYFLEKPQEVIHSTINQVADDLQVAEATIFRFCKRIGFKGFQAMKIALASEIVTPIQDIHENILEDDTSDQVAEKVFQSNIRTLQDTLNILNLQHFGEAVEYLLQAKKISFYGTGGSAIVALDAQHKFMRTGIPTEAFMDAHFQIMSASLMSKQDVAVFISHSGMNKDLLEIVDVAKKTGCKTIAITSFSKSPLTQKADLSLHTVSQETEYRSEALASRIAQLSIIDALFVNVMKERKEKAAGTLQKIREAIAVKKV